MKSKKPATRARAISGPSKLRPLGRQKWVLYKEIAAVAPRNGAEPDCGIAAKRRGGALCVFRGYFRTPIPWAKSASRLAA